jgi:membrane-bound metal-dependent hydrolase YbcI (DUF457 family)
MYAAGHLALGYVVGMATSKLLKHRVYLPLLFLVAVLPDIDYVLPDIARRTVTHSVIVQGVIALPLLVMYRRRALPYLLAVWSHSLIDLTNVAGVQLFWPISTYNHPLIPYPLVRQLDPMMGWGEVLLAGTVFIILFLTWRMPRITLSLTTTLLLLGPLMALLASLLVFRLSLTLRLAQVAFIILSAWPVLRYARRVLI